jgi:hypothetical protein
MKNVKDIAKAIFKNCPSCNAPMMSHVSRTPGAVAYYACSTKKHAFINNGGEIGAAIKVLKDSDNKI